MKGYITVISSLIITMIMTVEAAFTQQEEHVINLPPYVEKIYPSIKMISDGPRIYHESFARPPYLPNPEGEYSFFFRMIVARAEIWDRLYLEKVSTFDEEGIERRITASMYLNLDQLFPETDFDEQRYIKSISWVDSVTAEVTINQEPYRIDISEHIPFTIYSLPSNSEESRRPRIEYTMPQIVLAPEVKYPREARRYYGKIAEVIVTARIDTLGVVHDVEIVKSPALVFEKYAIRLAYKHRFKTGIVNGKATEMGYSWGIVFDPKN